MQETIHDEIRQAVRERYGRVAESSVTGCGCSTSCCDGEREPEPKKVEESVASGCGCTTSCCSGESPTTGKKLPSPSATLRKRLPPCQRGPIWGWVAVIRKPLLC